MFVTTHIDVEQLLNGVSHVEFMLAKPKPMLINAQPFSCGCTFHIPCIKCSHYLENYGSYTNEYDQEYALMDIPNTIAKHTYCKIAWTYLTWKYIDVTYSIDQHVQQNTNTLGHASGFD